MDGSDNAAASPQPDRGAGAAALDSGLFAVEAAQLAVDRHCTDVRLFDVRGRSHVCDWVLVASGTSDRQVRSVGREIAQLAREAGLGRYAARADEAATWLVIDCIDVVVHLFAPSRRAYYDIDELWSEATEVDFGRSQST